MGYEKRNPTYPEFTDHYFTGEYPIEPTDHINEKNNKLSLLSNISKK